jgi:hypothetical protein
MVDEPTKRPSWLTIGVIGAVASVGVYVFTFGSQIGAMRHQIETHDIRLDALETRGSGPVQATAEKVAGLTARADKILDGLLMLQQKMADLQATQQSQGVVLQRLQEDVSKQGVNRQ